MMYGAVISATVLILFILFNRSGAENKIEPQINSKKKRN